MYLYLLLMEFAVKKYLLLCFLFFINQPIFASPYQFNLQGHAGEVSDSDFKGQYILLTFGFTSCPDICPTILYEIAQTLKLLEHPEKLQVIFVSIDPNNDDLQRLQQYVGYFDKRILGLTADYESLKAMASAYGATFGYKHQGQEVTPPDLPLGYGVYHSSLTYLLSPERERLEVFTSQVKHKTMAQVIGKYLKQ